MTNELEAAQAEDCLAGGGEMGALMRSLDWSNTLLGPVSSWPQSLRTAVSILLASRFPMLIHWGPERKTNPRISQTVLRGKNEY
jgi:hypothetical protein